MATFIQRKRCVSAELAALEAANFSPDSAGPSIKVQADAKVVDGEPWLYLTMEGGFTEPPIFSTEYQEVLFVP